MRPTRSLRTQARRRRGTTLLEAALAAAISVALAGASLGAFRVCQDSYGRAAIDLSLRAQSTAILDAVAVALSECDGASVAISPPGENEGPMLTARRCVGLKDSRVEWDSNLALRCEPEPSAGEAAAAADGAGQDPGSRPWRLVLASGGRTRTLGTCLAPHGLQISRAGALATIRLELRRPVAGGLPARVVATRTVLFGS